MRPTDHRRAPRRVRRAWWTPRTPCVAVRRIRIIYDEVILVLRGPHSSSPEWGSSPSWLQRSGKSITNPQSHLRTLPAEHGRAHRGKVVLASQTSAALTPPGGFVPSSPSSWKPTLFEHLLTVPPNNLIAGPTPAARAPTSPRI